VSLQHGTGFRLDLAEPLHQLILAARALSGLEPAVVPRIVPLQAVNSDLIPSYGGIHDQNGDESCVPWEMIEMLGSSLAGQGYQGDKCFSAACAYWGGRAVLRKLLGMPLDSTLYDVGTAPQLVAVAFQDNGVCLESAWPYVAGQQTGTEESTHAAGDAATRKPIVLNAFQPLIMNGDVVQAIQAALLVRGGRVGLSIYASDAFKVADGSQVLTAQPSPGKVNHYVGIADYYTVISVNGAQGKLSNGMTVGFQAAPSVGDIVGTLVNHYGVDWGALCPIMPGTVLVDASFLRQAQFLYTCKAKMP
jgi:hypothetical protein